MKGARLLVEYSSWAYVHLRIQITAIFLPHRLTYIRIVHSFWSICCIVSFIYGVVFIIKFGLRNDIFDITYISIVIVNLSLRSLVSLRTAFVAAACIVGDVRHLILKRAVDNVTGNSWTYEIP